MATFELNIYNENDEIVKTYARSRIRWGLFLKAIEIHKELAGKSPNEQILMVSDFVCTFFGNMTEEDIKNADAGDVMNLFRQVVRKANQVGKEKNVAGAE